MERLQDFWMVNRPRLVSGVRWTLVLLVVGVFIFYLHAMTTVR